MSRRDWLALVAVHSDAWLISVAFYYGAKLDANARQAHCGHSCNSTSDMSAVLESQAVLGTSAQAQIVPKYQLNAHLV